MRKNNPEQSTADIQAELLDWVKDNKKDIYNPFLSLAGFPAIDTQSRSFTLFCWGS
ncbi:hypothetical protein CPB84DRAFT_1851888 [Gymnopilus junonius]|uniref:Uncharacterized protein n=1 Tax=Gymnopilus junonius TaxID=109634 RepID=A0A9P5TIU9_GYMJU|nr:hypothetical protein CPB84DRAFT_1851888 [Gymnopilus junonius]